MKILKLCALAAVVLALALASASRSAVESQTIQEAPTTDLNVLTDDLFNGLGQRGTPIDECVGGPPVPNRSFEDNKFIFEERETADDGLGPTYNDVACSSCHQSPETGGISQINEFRAGHLNSSGVFVNPPGGQSLIQLRAIAAPIQERLDNAPLENIRTFRTSLNTMGDGFVEAIANGTLLAIRDAQPAVIHGYGPGGWRDPRATQTYVLKEAAGEGLKARAPKAAAAAGGKGKRPRLVGDVIDETVGGRAGFLYYNGAHYLWYDPRAYTPPPPARVVHGGAVRAVQQ